MYYSVILSSEEYCFDYFKHCYDYFLHFCYIYSNLLPDFFFFFSFSWVCTDPVVFKIFIYFLTLWNKNTAV